MTVKMWATTKKIPFIDNNLRLEDNSEKMLRPALGNVLGLKLCIFIDLLLLHIEKSGAKKLLQRFGDRVHFALYRFC